MNNKKFGEVEQSKDLGEIINKRQEYEKLCEGVPDVFYVLSGGIVSVDIKEEKKFRSGSYADLDNHDFLSGGKGRSIATAELINYFPEVAVVTNSYILNNEPTHAKVMAHEIRHTGVGESKKIFLQEK